MGCTVDKILLRSSPPCGFGLLPRSHDQLQPGSLPSMTREEKERERGYEVDFVLSIYFFLNCEKCTVCCKANGSHLAMVRIVVWQPGLAFLAIHFG